MMLRPLFLIRIGLWVAIALLVFALSAGLIGKRDPDHRDPYDEKTTFRPIFTLIDHTGQMRTEKDFAGRWMLVFFGFTHCPDICPTTLAELAAVMDGLGTSAQDVQALFISIDPDRDTPETVAKFIPAFSPDIIGLTGSSEQIAKTARSFFIYYERIKDNDALDGYSLSHSSQLLLFDKQGYYVTSYRYGMLAEDIIADLQKKIIHNGD